MHNETMIYGYACISTAAQDESGQVKQLKAAGCQRIFREKITGITADRPQLAKLVKALTPGDVVITTAVDRLSRDTKDLLNITGDIQRAGAGIRSLAEPFLDTTFDLPRSFSRSLVSPRSSNAATFWSALRAAGPTQRPTASSSVASQFSRCISGKRPALASTQARRSAAWRAATMSVRVRFRGSAEMVDDQSIITEIERLRDPARRLFELSTKFNPYMDEWKKEFDEWRKISGYNDVISFDRHLVTLLRQHPVFSQQSERYFDVKVLALSPSYQVHNILKVAIEQGAEAAVAWLHRVVNIETADLRFITEVHGLQTDEQHTVSNGVTLMPLDKLPPSQQTRRALAAYDQFWTGHPINFPMLRPIAAMFLVPQVRARRDRRSKTSDDTSQKLRRTILAFTLASKHAAPVPGTSWIEFVDPDLAQAEIGHMWTGASFEGTLSQVPPTEITSDALIWVDQYLKLRSEVRNSCDIAIERLNVARRRRLPGDKAIDGAICLEALLGDANGQEITYKIRLRAALLLASTLEERREIFQKVYDFYNLRSKVVHGQRPKENSEVVDHGLEICAAALKEIVQRNKKFIPRDWELSGGEPLSGD